ncbi:ribonuclease inhibitor-like, partial [Clarias magur]
LEYCSVTEEGCAALVTALKSNSSSHLRKLNIEHNNLDESGVELFSDLLKDPNCKLKELR